MGFVALRKYSSQFQAMGRERLDLALFRVLFYVIMVEQALSLVG